MDQISPSSLSLEHYYLLVAGLSAESRFMSSMQEKLKGEGGDNIPEEDRLSGSMASQYFAQTLKSNSKIKPKRKLTK